MVVPIHCLGPGHNNLSHLLLLCDAVRAKVRLQQECELARLIPDRVYPECLCDTATESDWYCCSYNSDLQETSRV